MSSQAVNISLSDFRPTSRVLEATSTRLGTQRSENSEQQRLPRNVKLEDDSGKKNDDSLELSPPAKAKKSQQTQQKKSKDDSEKKSKTDTSQLSEDEQAVVDYLKKVDQKVRTHEQTHLSAAAQTINQAKTELNKQNQKPVNEQADSFTISNGILDLVKGNYLDIFV